MSKATAVDLKSYVRDIPDFPKPGILYRDITPLLASAEAFRSSIMQFADHYRDTSIDLIVAAEARGFVFAAPLALELDVGFVPIRKPGKLPADTRALEYQLEYGTDKLEIHVDGISPGQNILVVDDLLATGGTVEACCKLVERAGATVVECAFLIELASFQGAERLAPRKTFRLIRYD